MNLVLAAVGEVSMWDMAQTIVVLTFPLVCTVVGWFIAKIQAHDKELAIVPVKYQTKEEAHSSELVLTASINEVKELIHGLEKRLISFGKEDHG